MIRIGGLLLLAVGSLTPCFGQANYDAGYVEAAPHAKKGYALFQEGKLDQAESEYRQAVKFSGKTADFWLGLAAVCTKKERWQDVADAYAKVLELDPNNTSILADYSDALRRLKKFDEAIALLKRAVEIDSGNASLHQRLADLYTEKGNGDLAISEYQAAIGLKSDDPVLHYNLARLLWAVNQRDEAIQSYKTAEQLAPDVAAYHAAVGYSLYNIKDYNGAIEAFQKAARFAVNDVSIQQSLQTAINARDYEKQQADLKAKQEAAERAEAARLAPKYPKRHR